METNEKEKDESAFREEIRNLIVEWYSNCPHSMKFVSKTIKAYKERFPDDNFMKDVGHDL